MSQFLCDEMQDYIKALYGIEPGDRIFAITKSYLHHEMIRGAKEAKAKRIRIHDIRQAHIIRTSYDSYFLSAMGSDYCFISTIASSPTA